MLVKTTTGVNFINVLHQLLCAQIPKVQKLACIFSKKHNFFALLGSAGAKSAPGMLMKSTPGINFINILCARFLLIFWCQKITKPMFQLCNFWRQNFVQK